MLRLNEGSCIYLATTPVDFRKAINGLAALVLEQFETPVNDGSVYVFYNQDRDRVKCLYWDKNGFVLHHKRLDRGKFKLGKGRSGAHVITEQQLSWLLAGLDFMLMTEFPHLDYTHYF